MKKTAIIMLVLCLAFLAACGSIAEGPEESDAAVSTETSEADVAVENSEGGTRCDQLRIREGDMGQSV